SWSYKRAIKMGGTRDAKVINVRDGIAMFGGEQYAEYMLCSSCEQRFSDWEKYVANISQQLDGTFPALASAASVRTVEDWRYVDLSSLDTSALVRFGVSVIWRAHTSMRNFREIQLGPYAPVIAAYLL